MEEEDRDGLLWPEADAMARIGLIAGSRRRVSGEVLLRLRSSVGNRGGLSGVVGSIDCLQQTTFRFVQGLVKSQAHSEAGLALSWMGRGKTFPISLLLGRSSSPQSNISSQGGKTF